MNDVNYASILLVESDHSLRKVLSASLEQLDVQVLEAMDANHAQKILKNENPEILIVERDFPNGHNGEIIRSFRSHLGDSVGAVIVTTTDRLSDDWRRQYTPHVVVYKPFDVRHLCRVITTLLNEVKNKNKEAQPIRES